MSEEKKRAVMVYLPDGLHRWLKAKAALNGTTLSALVENTVLQKYPEASEAASQVSDGVALYFGGSSPKKALPRSRK